MGYGTLCQWGMARCANGVWHAVPMGEHKFDILMFSKI